MRIKYYVTPVITPRNHLSPLRFIPSYWCMFEHPRLLHLRAWPLQWMWPTLDSMFINCTHITIHKQRRLITHPRFHIRPVISFIDKPQPKFNVTKWVNLLYYTLFTNKKIIFNLMLLNLMMSYSYIYPYTTFFNHHFYRCKI